MEDLIEALTIFKKYKNVDVEPYEDRAEQYHHDRIVKTLEAKVKELQQCVVALASTLEEIEHGNALACALNATLIKESKEALG